MRRALSAMLGAAWLLSGCASHHAADPAAASLPPPAPLAAAGPAPRDTPRPAGQAPLQCVPYARAHSQVKLYGDAWTWWEQAAGKYERGPRPVSGSVMVLHNYAGPKHGHLAVVRRIVSPREIRIDHANWLNDGSIYVNNPVVDVSAANDWSQVRVFNIQTGAWGGKTYPVQGFIGAGASRPPAPPPAEAPMPDQAIDALIAELAASPPVRATAVPSVPAAQDRNPPANSAYALTADDLAIE